MEQLKTPLEIHREEASQHSQGISSSVIYDKVMSKLRQLKLQIGHLLDFGAGRGDFLKLLMAQSDLKFELHGIDLMQNHIDGVSWYVQDLNNKLKLESQQFDVVTCVEVIEHMENPRHIVRDIYNILKPGGYLILTTPNNESWRAMISYVIRGHFVSFTDSSYPAHITSLNRLDLERIFHEVGFTSVDFDFTDMGMVPKLSRWTWQKLSLGALKGVRYSDNLIAIARK
ncbi:MAG: methyltransferase domain-containing protein [Bdellovibrionales bacterium]|nr:methyltransferase domain-containing protein [Bdellovibrionales bacterium]